MAANSRAVKGTGARKVASPRQQAADAAEPSAPRRGRPRKAVVDAAVPVPEPTPARRGRPKATATAPVARAATRTAAEGAATRTARPGQARTAGAAIEPDEILPGRPASRTARPGRTTPEPQAPGSPAAESSPGAGKRNEDGVVDEAEVTWRGRMWLVHLPTIEQMTIYRRLSRRFQALGEAQAKPDAEPMSMDEATTHFDRALKLITSVLVKPEDIVWIEDEMLEGRLQLSDASELMRAAFERFGELNPVEETGTRAERRALKTGKARLAD